MPVICILVRLLFYEHLSNLAGTIYYHETLPPLLICDSFITIAATDGSLREVPICDILAADKGLRPGELIIKVSLEQDFARLPHSHVKKVQSEKIGYPLVSVSSICYQDQVRLAVSGLCSYPVRLKDISLQNNGSITELAAESLFDIKQPRIDDVSGSAAYREFILIKTVEKIIHSYMN